jgi:hypothetical protein
MFALLGIVGAAPARAQETQTTAGEERTVTVSVQGTDLFADSGVNLKAGDAVSIDADGAIVYRQDRPVSALGPEGLALERCTALERPGETRNVPVVGQPCWSLVGRIGKGEPFGIGAKLAFIARTSGPLLLGVNDGVPGDNGGEWTANITVTPGVAPPTPITAAADGGSNSMLIPLVLGALVLVLAAALLLYLYVRGRNRDDDADDDYGDDDYGDDEPEPTLAPLPDDALVAAAVGATASAAPPHAPFNPESAEVYIFRVAFVSGALDVGYNFLPHGTDVSWRVLDSGVELAAGTFVAVGGGSEQHFARLPLGDAIEAHDDVVDIVFTWAINEVPFGYSVRRDPRS